MGYDRPSPDHANARFILLISSHLETGHYFNPHAQRIIEAKMKGAKIAVLDPRLSNTATHADYWLPTWPGSEAALLLAMANLILREELYDREFVRRWTNWEQYLRSEHPTTPLTFENFLRILKETYASYTPEFAEAESGVPAATIVRVAREIGQAGSAFSAHVWRAAAAGNLGGWQVARALFFLNVLTGSVGTPGGTSPNLWDKYIPAAFQPPHRRRPVWNELLWPPEYPLAHNEMSFLLPYFLKEGRGKLAVYFTRVYNPVWTNPDGMSWVEVLRDEEKVELHAALTPTWNETTIWADYVLPMGHGPERHDTHSYETQAARWLGFRQPVFRVAREKAGEPVSSPTRQTRARYGRRTSSGSSSPGGSIPTARSASAAISSRRTGRARRSRSRSITAGSSSTACPACRRRRRPKDSHRWSTCANTPPSPSIEKVYDQHERALLTPEELEGAAIDAETGVITTTAAPARRTGGQAAEGRSGRR